MTKNVFIVLNETTKPAAIPDAVSANSERTLS